MRHRYGRRRVLSLTYQGIGAPAAQCSAQPPVNRGGSWRRRARPRGTGAPAVTPRLATRARALTWPPPLPTNGDATGMSRGSTRRPMGAARGVRDRCSAPIHCTPRASDAARGRFVYLISSGDHHRTLIICYLLVALLVSRIGFDSVFTRTKLRPTFTCIVHTYVRLQQKVSSWNFRRSTRVVRLKILSETLKLKRRVFNVAII